MIITKDKNPIFNRNLNPIFNRKINPIFNRDINPIFNKSINPIFNRNINPIFNRNINPIFNRNLNPIFNRNINPIFNRDINPIFNKILNPSFNDTFDGLFLFDLNTSYCNYAINYKDIYIFFDKENFVEYYGFPHINNGYIIYDSTITYYGHLEDNTESGYNLFDKNNNWINYLV